MARTSARLSSSQSNSRQAAKENQIVDTATPTTNRKPTKARKAVPHSVQPGRTVSTSTGAGLNRKKKANLVSPRDETRASSITEPLTTVRRNDDSDPAQREDDASSTSTTTFSDTTNARPDCSAELQRMREERDRLIAEIQSLRNQVNVSQPSRSATQATLIPRPEGRRIRLQEDMGLADDKGKFKSIRRTMKDALLRAGLDPMVRWGDQPKEKLAKIFFIAKDRQPYLKRFAHNWPIEEYIKRHHKHVRAYIRRVAKDGTNETLPNVESDEISDSQGDVVSDQDMYGDDE